MLFTSKTKEKGDIITVKQIFGKSNSGNLKEAVRGITNPKLLLLMSNADQFEAHVEELERLFPGVPSIGCIGMSYDKSIVEKGVGIVAFSENIIATANVIEQVSTMPVKYIERVEQDLRTVGASERDTVCIDLCSGNDACVLTTLYSVLGKQRIQLMGGTGDKGKVSANGIIYEDADAYALIKNQGGKVKVYKENLYLPMPGQRFIASATDRSRYYLGELNGRSAKQVYQEVLQIGEKDIGTQTFRNPFGKLDGEDMCIISIKEVSGNGLCCFRQVNDSDVLTLLELQDYQRIAGETIQAIQADFKRISGIFSVNCAFRYLLFTQEHQFSHYLELMAGLGNHAGLIGYGEHYNKQFVNQTMTCVVFE